MRILLSASRAQSLTSFRGPLIDELIRQNYVVHVTAPNVPSDVRAKIEQRGVIVHSSLLQRASVSPFSDLKYMFYMRRLISQIEPDVILTYTIKPNIWGSFAARFSRTPTLAMFTGLGYAFTEPAEFSFKQKIVQGISRILIRLSTSFNRMVIFQNRDDRADLYASGGLARSTDTRIVNGSGIDLTRFLPQPLPDQTGFLMAGRMLKNKGVREYCKAAVALKKQYPDVSFAYAGSVFEGADAIDDSDLAEWSANGVDFLGWQTDIRPCMAKASVYVLPSYREGTPRSVLEALALGRPVITTDAPGCRETVEDGVNGFLVPVQDSASLEDRMRFFIENPDVIGKMGQKSLDLAREKYDVKKVNKQVISAIEYSLS